MAWPARLLGRHGRGRPHSDPGEGKRGGGRPAPWAAPWEPEPARRTGWPGRPRGSHFAQALEGGETEALRGGWTCGRTLPTSRAELSVALTEKLSGGKTHTLKTLASSPNLSFPVTVQFPLTNNRHRGNGGRQVPSPMKGPAAQAWTDLSRGCQLPLSRLHPSRRPAAATPLSPCLSSAAWPGWWEACAASSWQLPVPEGDTPPGQAH